MNFELILVGPVGCQECEICKFFAVCITAIVSHSQILIYAVLKVLGLIIILPRSVVKLMEIYLPYRICCSPSLS